MLTIDRLEAGTADNPFTLLIRKPTPADRLANAAYGAYFLTTRDHSEIASQLQFRMGFVVGWDEVMDDAGQPVEFTRARLESAFAADPAFAWDVTTALAQLFAEGSR